MDSDCRHEGCGKPRVSFSVFCDEHHREQLIRAGVVSPVPPDPCEDMSQKCARVLRNRTMGGISMEELLVGLFDVLMRGASDGADRCWEACFAELPQEVIRELLVHTERYDRPRLFAPLPQHERERAEKSERALKTQAHLIDRLRAYAGKQ